MVSTEGLNHSVSFNVQVALYAVLAAAAAESLLQMHGYGPMGSWLAYRLE
jgi:hypothetical protein